MNVVEGSYTVKQVAALLEVPVAVVRGYLRAGLVKPGEDVAGEPRFGFEELVLLRAIARLEKGAPAEGRRKVRRALRRLSERGQPLSALRLEAVEGRVVVRQDGARLDAESGQALLDLDRVVVAEEGAPPVSLLARRTARDAARAGALPAQSADEWFARACSLEDPSGVTPAPAEAEAAYRRALELDPGHVEARLNLGRLLQLAGDGARAEVEYRAALSQRPEDPEALYNLGNVLEDLGRDDEAARAYEDALRAAPDDEDALYNLGYVYERLGRRTDALRVLGAYHRLKTR